MEFVSSKSKKKSRSVLPDGSRFLDCFGEETLVLLLSIIPLYRFGGLWQETSPYNQLNIMQHLTFIIRSVLKTAMRSQQLKEANLKELSRFWAWQLLHISLLVMNIFNKTDSAICISLVLVLALKGSSNQLIYLYCSWCCAV